MLPIAASVAPLVQYLAMGAWGVLVLLGIVFTVGRFRTSAGQGFATLTVAIAGIAASGVVGVIAVGLAPDARIDAIEQTYGVTLTRGQLEELGYGAQANVKSDAGEYTLGSTRHRSLGKVHLVWDGQELLRLTDADGTELPRI
ncbi:hypothetical protein SAMN04488590_3267 [Microbacterium sp. 77mftsu3.1]|nr:hypothetical protein SAMN04488590_3267 [Microbacterium sp. 77mftsu3.1]